MVRKKGKYHWSARGMHFSHLRFMDDMERQILFGIHWFNEGKNPLSAKTVGMPVEDRRAVNGRLDTTISSHLIKRKNK